MNEGIHFHKYCQTNQVLVNLWGPSGTESRKQLTTNDAVEIASAKKYTQWQWTKLTWSCRICCRASHSIYVVELIWWNSMPRQLCGFLFSVLYYLGQVLGSICLNGAQKLRFWFHVCGFLCLLIHSQLVTLPSILEKQASELVWKRTKNDRASPKLVLLGHLLVTKEWTHSPMV